MSDTASLIAGAIPVVGGLASGIINGANQRAADERSNEWAIQDRTARTQFAIDQWNRENEYNSPVEQVKRLRLAGINPNTAYGSVSNVSSHSMSPGGSVATAHAANLPDYGHVASSALAAYQSVRMQNAQVGAMTAQATDAVASAALKGFQKGLVEAETTKAAADTDRSRAETMRTSTLLPYDAAVRSQEVRKLEADTKFQLSENDRRTAANSMSLREAAVRIMESRSRMATNDVERRKLAADIAKINADTSIAELDAQLKRQGLQPHDALWQRALYDNILEPFNRGKDVIKSWFNPPRVHTTEAELKRTGQWYK